MGSGKGSKKRSHIKKMMANRAKRTANQTKYQALAEEGKNKKSKRHVLSSRRKRRSNEKHQHRTGFCGNVSCIKCFPLDALGKAKVKGPASEPTKREKAFAGVLILRSTSHVGRPNRGKGRLLALGRQGVVLEATQPR